MHIKITEKMHQELKNHLHSGDGLEAIAFALCGRHSFEGQEFLLTHKILLIEYERCIREVNTVSWKTIDLEPFLEEAAEKGLGIVKFHSHFIQGSEFSELDDKSDVSVFDTVYSWVNGDNQHASIVMYPNGSMKGRIVTPALTFENVEKISVIGNSVTNYCYTTKSQIEQSFIRNAQAFGEKTVKQLSTMKIGVVGCSGTGSPVIEQLYRLGVGHLVLVDSDHVGVENLNRIISSKKSDAEAKRLKVEVIRDHIQSVDIGTKVTSYTNLLQESRQVVDDLASCDYLFGCMDSVEGRHYLNLISTNYLVPLTDIGVKLMADGNGGINSIVGNIHYVYSGSQTLLERGVYTATQLAEESLKRISPEEHQNRQVYFNNVEVDSPAVISVNTLCSSIAVNDMLGRLHPYRFQDNVKYSTTVINLTDWDFNYYSVSETKEKLHYRNIGVGNLEPNFNIYVNEKNN
ncbi:ThiF family protein [Tenacibaculum adriaticum]|uniref:ThiF family protein n=1 Tax=Tenacibaculum adriaticum TaxID=413713 RepID=A0A5S5DYX0_9FLAO|nr:ThiF family adenylyltransferase [Tenacibaculum adriaticum]TYQ00237.1 ThiF family protein [Tenacibaculum adriaticum]